MLRKHKESGTTSASASSLHGPLAPALKKAGDEGSYLNPPAKLCQGSQCARWSARWSAKLPGSWDWVGRDQVQWGGSKQHQDSKMASHRSPRGATKDRQPPAALEPLVALGVS